MTTITLNINNLNGTTLCGRGIPMGLMLASGAEFPSSGGSSGADKRVGAGGGFVG